MCDGRFMETKGNGEDDFQCHDSLQLRPKFAEASLRSQSRVQQGFNSELPPRQLGRGPCVGMFSRLTSLASTTLHASPRPHYLTTSQQLKASPRLNLFLFLFPSHLLTSDLRTNRLFSLDLTSSQFSQLKMGDFPPPPEIDPDNSPFPLTAADRKVLKQTDDEFHRHTWEELKQIIGMASTPTTPPRSVKPSR